MQKIPVLRLNLWSLDWYFSQVPLPNMIYLFNISGILLTGLLRHICSPCPQQGNRFWSMSWVAFLVIFLELPTPTEHQSSHPVFGGVHVTRFLVLCVLFCRSLFVLFCPFSFGHCVVCTSYIFGFILRRWDLQTLLVATILNIPPLSQYLSSIIYNSLSMFRPTGLDF